jgi:hypothetical protein
MDDARDEGKLLAGQGTKLFGKAMDSIKHRYPRQCKAMETCLAELSDLEQENCPNPDLPANCFGKLMAELFVFEEDLWANSLRQMGISLGRFIYLADAMADYRKDKRKKKYNPFIAMGMEEDWSKWDEILVLTMSRCTAQFEKLPLVQDKMLLNNILYSGVWGNFHRKKKEGRDGIDQ